MLDFHRELLADQTRTLGFRDAIRQAVQPGDVVVDIGAGSGILSYFAIEAGAARVYAIEKQHTADAAALLARHNGYDDRLVVIHQYSVDAILPDRADLAITETLGMFALDEQILGLVIDARQRLLRAGARIIPSRLELVATPVTLAEKYERHVSWWTDARYGLDLAPLRTFASNSQYGAAIDEDAHLAAPATLIDVDLHTIDTTTVTGNATFEVTRDAVCHGFGGWFNAMLIDDPPISITNRKPHETHWMQAFLPLETPVEVKRGDRVELELQTHDGRSWRWRGRIENEAFDQMTWLAAPPCLSAKK